MKSRISTSIVAIGLAVLVACGSGPGLRPAVRSSNLSPGAVRSQFEVKTHHEITGDTNYVLDVESIVDIVEIYGPSAPKGFWSLTASTGSFDITAEDGALFIWSADLTPGGYDGPGTYEINGKDAPTLAPSSSIRSAAYMQIARPIVDDDAVTRYEVLVEPCTLTVTAEMATGTVHCPKLGLDRDPSRTISWTWTWERLTGTSTPSPSSSAPSTPSPSAPSSSATSEG